MLHKNKNNSDKIPLKGVKFLSQMRVENNFHTPKNYFESLPEIISIKNLENNTLKYTFDKLSYRILIPFVGILILVVSIFNIEKTPSIPTLTSEQVSEILVNDTYLDLDEEMILEAYYEMEEEGSLTSSKDDELIEYLIENNIKVNSIIEEL